MPTPSAGRPALSRRDGALHLRLHSSGTIQIEWGSTTSCSLPTAPPPNAAAARWCLHDAAADDARDARRTHARRPGLAGMAQALPVVPLLLTLWLLGKEWVERGRFFITLVFLRHSDCSLPRCPFVDRQTLATYIRAAVVGGDTFAPTAMLSRWPSTTRS